MIPKNELKQLQYRLPGESDKFGNNFKHLNHQDNISQSFLQSFQIKNCISLNIIGIYKQTDKERICQLKFKYTSYKSFT